MKHDYSTLLHFLRTGELESLKIGMTVDEVFAFLGEPDNREWDDYGHSSITYGCLHMSTAVFHPDIIFDIRVSIQDYPEHNLPDSLSSNWLADVSTMSVKAFKAFLHENNLPSAKERVDSYSYCLRHPHYVLISHASTRFMREDDISVESILVYTRP